MKVYLVTNKTDCDWVDLYQIWKGRKLMIGSFCTDALDQDLSEALIASEKDDYPLELELK